MEVKLLCHFIYKKGKVTPQVLSDSSPATEVLMFFHNQWIITRNWAAKMNKKWESFTAISLVSCDSWAMSFPLKRRGAFSSPEHVYWKGFQVDGMPRRNSAAYYPPGSWPLKLASATAQRGRAEFLPSATTLSSRQVWARPCLVLLCQEVMHAPVTALPPGLGTRSRFVQAKGILFVTVQAAKWGWAVPQPSLVWLPAKWEIQPGNSSPDNRQEVLCYCGSYSF